MNCSTLSVQYLQALTQHQRSAFRKAQITDAAAIITSSPVDIANLLNITLTEAQTVIQAICRELSQHDLDLVKPSNTRLVISVGDPAIDAILDGGIHTGMVWELCGESAVGKTQLALQLSLLVQLPPAQGGLCGSCCYLTAQSHLATKRLLQLATEHPLLSNALPSLLDIHHCHVPTIDVLRHVLQVVLPRQLREILADSSRKQVRLVVIDSITAVIRSGDSQSKSTLFDRSRYLYDFSQAIHTLVSSYDIAVVVINDVHDVFDSHEPALDASTSSHVLYRDQARWFSHSDCQHVGKIQAASLGLVWANQVNARLILARTNKRKRVDQPRPGKRIRTESSDTRTSDLIAAEGSSEQTSVIRCLSVGYGATSPAKHVPFIIVKQGIVSIDEETSLQTCDTQRNLRGKARIGARLPQHTGLTEFVPSSQPDEGAYDVDDAAYWDFVEDIPTDAYSDTGFDSVQLDVAV